MKACSPPKIEIVGEIGVRAQPSVHPLDEAQDVGPGEVLPARRMDELVRDLGEHVVGDEGVAAGLLEAEAVVGGRGQGRDAVVHVAVEVSAADAEQGVVAEGQVGIGGDRVVRIGVAEVVVVARRVGGGGVGLVGRVGHGIAAALVLEEVHDEAGPGPEVLQGLGGQLEGGVPAFLGPIVGIDTRIALDGHVHDPVPLEDPRSEGPEEPETVLDDVAAEEEADFVGVLRVLADVLVVRVVAGQIVVAQVERQLVAALALEGRARIVADELAVEGVAARAGDDVDDAADRAAVFGVIAGGLELDLLGEIEDHVLLAGPAVQVRGVRPVDEKNVLGPRGAVDRDAVEQVVLALDARQDGHQRIEAAALGQGVEGLGREDLAPGRVLDVDERGLADDHDLLFDGAGLQGDVHDQRLFDGQDDIVADDRAEALEAIGDGVGAGGKGEQAVNAVRVGDGGRDAHEARALRLHRDAGERRPLVVFDRADDPAGCRSLG